MQTYRLVVDFGKSGVPNFHTESEDLLLIGRAYVELKRHFATNDSEDADLPTVRLYKNDYEIRDFEQRYGPRIRHLAELQSL